MKKLNPTERLHQSPIPVIGLTGGIACGKSTVAKFLKDLNQFVIDADQLVKSIYADQASIDFVSGLAPECVKTNKIDFPLLRKLFFEKGEIKTKIEQFIYAQMPQKFHQELKKCSHSIVFYDVPLLFERGLDQMVDTHACVYIPKDLQVERLIERDHISSEAAEKILSHQMPIEEKKKKCDVVIDNSGSLEATLSQTKEWLKVLQAFY